MRRQQYKKYVSGKTIDNIRENPFNKEKQILKLGKPVYTGNTIRQLKPHSRFEYCCSTGGGKKCTKCYPGSGYRTSKQYRLELERIKKGELN